MNNIYLERYAWPGPNIAAKPKPGTKIIVVIPCFFEPEIIATLNSLLQCSAPDCHVEVITVINHSKSEAENIRNYNLASAKEIDQWNKSKSNDQISFKSINAFDLPKKYAGVGLARKIGMDEAVRRFEILQEKKGIIVCFDADSLCSVNYLEEIYNCFSNNLNVNVGLIYFEHPLNGPLSKKTYEGIINYELHLRYYKNMLKNAGFPFSFHTIGSCIAVSTDTYQKQGGMNKKKAGEDFYFLQKVFPHGGVHNITSATVTPSPRASDRVPFGTGRAINEFLKRDDRDYQSYNPASFIDIKALFEGSTQFFNEKILGPVLNTLPESIQRFSEEIKLEENINKLRRNSNSSDQFIKAFFQWFNGFTVLKFIHFARDNYYKNIDLLEAVNYLLIKKNLPKAEKPTQALLTLRELDRSDE